MSTAAPSRTRTIRPSQPIDLGLTLGPLQVGRADPSTRMEPGGKAIWLARRTPEGPVTLVIRQRSEEIHGEAWGPGAEHALASLPDRVGDNDSLDGFSPTGRVAEVHRASPGLRIAKSGDVFLSVLRAITEQKVTGLEAGRAYRGMHTRFSEPAPGPHDFTLPPDPAILKSTPYYEFHEIYLERRRAELVRFVATRAKKLDQLATMPLVDAKKRILAFPGIGPWSLAEIARRALGDSDALSVGDYHLKNYVAFFMNGRARGTDEEMLETLAPYEGHRGRVQRLIESSGIHAPRFGPRRPVKRID